MKVRSDGHLESEFFIYVDDGHIISQSELVCSQAAISPPICIPLGIKDVSRKRTEPYPILEPWAETVAHTCINEVVISIMEVKWGGKESFLDMETLLKEDRVPHKTL